MRAPSKEVRDSLLCELVSWLEAERASLMADWARQGLPPTVMRTRPLGQVEIVFQPATGRPGHGTVTAQCRLTQEDVEVSRLNVSGDAPLVLSLRTPPPVDTFMRVYGDDFVDSVLMGAQELDSALIGAKADGPAGRLTPLFARLAGDYVAMLPAVTSGDLILARKVAESYLEFVEADEVTWVDSIPIGGVAPPETPIDAGHAGLQVTLRKLGVEEVGELLRSAMPFDTMDPPKVRPVGLQNEALPASCMCTCLLTARRRQAKIGAGHPPKGPLAQTVLALQLMGYDIFGPGAGASWTEPGPRLAQFGVNVPMPRLLWGLPGPRAFSPLGRDELLRALDLMGRIPEGCFDQVGGRREVALNRFSSATAQEQDANALIDYVIALEALLVPDAGKTETTLRFRLNGARYLAADTEERALLFADLGKLYEARSTLVHGNETRKLRNLPDLRRTAQALAARGIVKAVESHWPTAEEFQTAALR